MEGIKRLPYRLSLIIWGSETCELRLAYPDADAWFHDAFPLDLPIDIAAFIHFHCSCTYCGARISRDLAKCNCGKPDEQGMHLEVTFPTNIHNSIFQPILKRESGRIRSALRAQLKRRNGGTYTVGEIATLYRLQEGICFFCGVPISQNGHGSTYHIDHYIPLSSRGTNDLSNLVLTCCSCNLHKSDMHPSDFERKIKKNRTPDISIQLKEIRRARNAYIKSKGLGSD
ncbi:MAG: HNH endonuclease [Betaproteobacteria bacterium]|nr:HNH endonuclease [Betaproteobacteria bacterium]